jgi:large subunit ribosomal protein L13
MNKTYNQKSAEVTREWVIIDASEAPLGRLATLAAKRLIGKHKPTYTAHVDGGDYVIVINAANIVVTGAKETDKNYYRYSGYPSGMKEENFQQVMAKDPARIFVAAVKGMLPKNKLAAERLKRLKVYADDAHGHNAQKPVKIGAK